MLEVKLLTEGPFRCEYQCFRARYLYYILIPAARSRISSVFSVTPCECWKWLSYLKFEMVTDMANKDSQMKHCTEGGFTVPAVLKSLLLPWLFCFFVCFFIILLHTFAWGQSQKQKNGCLEGMRQWPFRSKHNTTLSVIFPYQNMQLQVWFFISHVVCVQIAFFMFSSKPRAQCIPGQIFHVFCQWLLQHYECSH